MYALQDLYSGVILARGSQEACISTMATHIAATGQPRHMYRFILPSEM